VTYLYQQAICKMTEAVTCTKCKHQHLLEPPSLEMSVADLESVKVSALGVALVGLRARVPLLGRSCISDSRSVYQCNPAVSLSAHNPDQQNQNHQNE